MTAPTHPSLADADWRDHIASRWPTSRLSTRMDRMFRERAELTEADIQAAEREGLEADTFNRSNGETL